MTEPKKSTLNYIRHPDGGLPIIMQYTAPYGRVYSLLAETWQWRDAVDWPWTERINTLRGDVTAAGCMEVVAEGVVIGDIFHQPFSYPHEAYWGNLTKLRWSGKMPSDNFISDFHDTPPYATPMGALMHFAHNAEAFYKFRHENH